MKASELRKGDRYWDHSRGIVVDVLEDPEPHMDRFGRAEWRVLARREDTQATGYVLFGLDAEVLKA